MKKTAFQQMLLLKTLELFGINHKKVYICTGFNRIIC